MKVRFFIFMLSATMTIMTCSLGVGANPAISPGFYYITSAEGIVILFAANFFVNLLLFALFLLAILKLEGTRAGKINPNRGRFFVLIIFSGVFITAVGSVVDIAFLYRIGDQWMQIHYDAEKWSAAVFLIFLSVFIASWGVMRVRAVMSLVPAGGMAIVNWLMWSTVFQWFDTVLCLPPLVFVIILMIPVFHLLWRWHRAEFPDKKSDGSNIAAHP